jgi:hypothetical protein
MAEEKQREQNRLRQQRHRDRKRGIVPDASDYEMPRTQSERLEAYSKVVTEQIRKELGRLGKNDDYILRGIAHTVVCLENKWTQTVQNPEGVLTGGYFPDAIASEAIQHLHHSHLAESPAFMELYKRFLLAVVTFCDKADQRYIAAEYASEIKAEIATQ